LEGRERAGGLKDSAALLGTRASGRAMALVCHCPYLSVRLSI
jgi:hypothetical protein